MPVVRAIQGTPPLISTDTSQPDILLRVTPHRIPGGTYSYVSLVMRAVRMRHEDLQARSMRSLTIYFRHRKNRSPV